MITIQIVIWMGAGIVALITMNYVYKTYNKLVNLRINVERQSSNVEVHLKKKFDMVPALLDIVKGYTKQEKGTF